MDVRDIIVCLDSRQIVITPHLNLMLTPSPFLGMCLILSLSQLDLLH